MSTNSRVGILHQDGVTETIYCHWDGYPEHQMPILGERISPDAYEPHSFEKPADGVTVAYHRDRKEPMQPAVSHKSVVSLMSDDWGIPYYYLFDEEKGAWLPPTED